MKNKSKTIQNRIKMPVFMVLLAVASLTIVLLTSPVTSVMPGRVGNYGIFQLTDNISWEDRPRIHDGMVTWCGSDGYYYGIFLYDGISITQLTNRTYDESDPQIHDGMVTWWGFDGDDYEIFLALPLYNFVSFVIDNLKIGFGEEVGGDNFAVRGAFVLSEESDGVNPIIESVVFKLDDFEENIPAGSFVQKDDSVYLYEGEKGFITLMEINTKKGTFSIKADGLDLTGKITNLVTIELYVDIDFGSTEVRLKGKLSN